MAIKLCTDCEHYKSGPYASSCKSPDVIEHHYNGHHAVGIIGIPPEEARNQGFLGIGAGACGKNAKYFEPKKPSDRRPGDAEK